MSRTIETTVYTFDELSDEAKERARDWWCASYPLGEWWDCTYEDAKMIGLKITGFDIGRANEITGEFITSAIECSEAILKEHGETCETYKTAQAFCAAIDALPELPEENDPSYWDIERDLCAANDEAEADFLQSLLEDYLILLRHEYEYQMSDDCVDENILANEYEFTEEGERA